MFLVLESYRSPHSWPAHLNAFKKNDATDKWESIEK
jgi:hypothetical protein